jgi:hypothetical protein
VSALTIAGGLPSRAASCPLSTVHGLAGFARRGAAVASIGLTLHGARRVSAGSRDACTGVLARPSERLLRPRSTAAWRRRRPFRDPRRCLS